MIDRYTKIVLTMIAAGLWANALAQMAPATAQDSAAVHLRNIDNNIDLIATGRCVNRKLC